MEILKKLEMCQELILKMHTDDETNRNANNLKYDLQLLLKIKNNVKNSIIDVKLLKKLNFIYKDYKTWERTYEGNPE